MIVVVAIICAVIFLAVVATAIFLVCYCCSRRPKPRKMGISRDDLVQNQLDIEEQERSERERAEEAELKSKMLTEENMKKTTASTGFPDDDDFPPATGLGGFSFPKEAPKAPVAKLPESPPRPQQHMTRENQPRGESPRIQRSPRMGNKESASTWRDEPQIRRHLEQKETNLRHSVELPLTRKETLPASAVFPPPREAPSAPVPEKPNVVAPPANNFADDTFFDDDYRIDFNEQPNFGFEDFDDM
jgi:hypothetical protein